MTKGRNHGLRREVKILAPRAGRFWHVLANNAWIWAPKVLLQVLGNISFRIIIGWLGATQGLQLICDHGYGHDKVEINFFPKENEMKKK